MKVWNQYGSEHSMNLVMIGSFKRETDAEAAKLLIEEITERVAEKPPRSYDDDPKEARFSDEWLNYLVKTNLMTVGAAELDQFQYDFRLEVKGKDLVLTTDESDVSGILKVMLEKGAKIEVYSAHDYPDETAEDGTKLGR
jgi:hypothetical protein